MTKKQRRRQHQRIQLRIYQEIDPDLYHWYAELEDVPTSTKGEQVKALLRAGLQAQRGEQATTAANAPQATAAVDTDALVAALLPEFRAVLSAALATAHLTSSTASTAVAEEDDPEMQDFLAALDDSIFLD